MRLPTPQWRSSLLLLSCVFTLASAAPAVAGVAPVSEPTYTKTAGNNAFWYSWSAIQGYNQDGSANNTWYLCFHTYDTSPNGSQAEVETSNGANGPGSSNCTGNLRGGSMTGTWGGTPFTTGTVLQDGHRYDMCAGGYYASFVIWKWDQSSACPWTIIDRNAPAATVSLAGGAAYTSTVPVPVRIDYSDATSPPWAGAGGRASNWVCGAQNAACSPGGSPNSNCSVPADAASRTTFFTCTAEVTGDGHWYVCAKAADGAVPDNPSSSNQFVNATSNNANISPVSCDDVVVDRAAPAVTVRASATSVTAGTQVSFTASATDATSGPSGTYSWTFGDNTTPGSGNAPVHTYTQPGTYEARATTTDAAGNSGTNAVNITVTPAPGGGTTTTPGGTTTTPGGTTTTPGGTTTTPAGTTTTPGGTTTTPGAATTGGTGGAGGGPSGGSGAGATATGSGAASAAALKVTAPKTLTLSSARPKLGLSVTVPAAGRVDVVLLRSGRTAARATARATKAGTVRLAPRLPARTRPGTYRLRVTFRPKAGGRAITKQLTVKVAKARRKARAAALVGIPLAR